MLSRTAEGHQREKADEAQKKADEARRKAEEEAKAKAPQQPSAPPAPSPSSAAVPIAPSPPDVPRDGTWSGALTCKQYGRQSIKGDVVNGKGRLYGSTLTVSLTITGATASLSVQSQAVYGPNGPMSGEVNGKRIFAKGLLQRFAGSPDECTVSIVGP